MFLPGPEGGSAITDAASEALRIVNIAAAVHKLKPVAPKGGVRFHFTLPGSVQGWQLEQGEDNLETVALENPAGLALELGFKGLAPGRVARAAAQTFLPAEVPFEVPRGSPWKYRLLASPSLYAGQTVHARLEADQPGVCARLFIRVYGSNDQLERMTGPALELRTGEQHELEWRVPNTNGQPIAEVGIEVSSDQPTDGRVRLDSLSWDGEPDVTFRRVPGEGLMWLRAWVDSVDRLERRFPESFRLIQNQGTGLLIQGASDWRNYSVGATFEPHLARSAGLAARVQGLRRYYALLLVHPGLARLIKMRDEERVLAETPLAWAFGGSYDLRLEVMGARLRAWIDGHLLFDLEDDQQPLESGGIALVIEEGRLSTDAVQVRPIRSG